MCIRKLLNKIFYISKIHYHGKNNKFICPTSVCLKKVKIVFWGNNNKIILDDNVYLNNAKIIIGFPNCRVENCVIKIGLNSSFNSLYLQIGENNNVVNIGKNCMFSYGIDINSTDHHSIFDENNNLINMGKRITIGDNVWVCKDVKIMKNTNIPSGCVIAQGSIVTKKFEKENCVIAGNPAKVVKQNIHWDRIRPNNWIKDFGRK